MDRSWTEGLAQRVGGGRVVLDPDIIAAHARDQAPLAEAGTALALVRARSVEDVVHTLRYAHERRIPVVPRAAGTGLSGGANAVDGGIVLSVAAMDQILEIDPAARLAVVEPGVINATLAARAEQVGLYYAPDPSSRDISTIGGNIATNAGGACCFKYGVTGDHVLALRAITADGSCIETGCRAPKNVAGLDLTRLLVGSEGTLAVIVEATVRLLRQPPPASTLVAFFETMEQAAAAILGMEQAADLSLIEVMDRTTVAAVESLTSMGLDTGSTMVLVQSDAPRSVDMIEACERVCAEASAKDVFATSDPHEGAMMLAARRAALPALEKLGTPLLDDVAVPRPALPAMFARCEAAAARNDVVIGTFGHAGDGNLHPTILFDRHDPRSEAAARRAFVEIVEDALALGGTVTGEHGVGTLKRPFLERMVGTTEAALMRRIKAAFDPHGILNPTKVL
ncbi:MAG: FAD-linked oxidase C-terminal domain-containing protein [Myxococcota bacterium]